MSEERYPLPKPLITVSPNRLGGEPCFAGLRVPVEALFDYLKDGQTVDEFLEDFPSVSREHAVAVIESANRAVVRLEAAE